jgi:hypothetical protein
VTSSIGIGGGGWNAARCDPSFNNLQTGRAPLRSGLGLKRAQPELLARFDAGDDGHAVRALVPHRRERRRAASFGGRAGAKTGAPADRREES